MTGKLTTISGCGTQRDRHHPLRGPNMRVLKALKFIAQLNWSFIAFYTAVAVFWAVLLRWLF